ncbi:MAG: S8 family serine peptidase, partial [Rubrivivax sp.]
YGALLSIAQLRGDWAAVPALVETLRGLQDKPGPRATTGVMAGILGEQQTQRRDAAWVQAEVTRRYGALPWADVADSVKGLKSQLELLNPELVRGSFEQQLDVMARNMNLNVPEAIVGTIVGARVQQELVVPQRGALVAGLQAVIDRQADTTRKPDLWTPRLFSIAPTARASEVGVAIWDSGVDLSLFKTLPGRGMAFNEDATPSPHLLRPLGEAEARWPQLKQLVKGAMDLRAALDTPDARQLRQVVGSLKADQAKAFQEDLALASLYTHGTHVAGIAVEGNPFARVYAASMLWSHKSEPPKPTEERSRRTAAAYQQIVDGFKAQKVRVVNMSWRYGASAYEGMLAWHNVGGTPEERKQIARRLFAIERDALKAAIASAPDILFIAGSGNEDNSADFAEYIPAGLELPNLITVGAVDTAGQETSFSTFGKTVVVHANGFEVESVLPGGDRVKFSGTSMASPQVANLAAKLFALKPELTVAQARQAILGAADPMGRIRLLNPRRSAELAGVKL